ncbi:MAG: hypothetical protein N2C14_15675, partial [Planctomycetales bacterium]
RDFRLQRQKSHASQDHPDPEQSQKKHHYPASGHRNVPLEFREKGKSTDNKLRFIGRNALARLEAKRLGVKSPLKRDWAVNRAGRRAIH